MEFNFTFQNFELVPEHVRLVFVIYTWIVQIINFLSYSFTMYCVLKYSADIMATYKWYIIASLTSIEMYLMIMSSYEIELYTYYSFTLSRGVVEYFNIPRAAIFLQGMSFTFFEMYTVTTLCRFLYRYAQSTDKQKMLYIMSHRLFFLGLFFVFLFILLMTGVDGWNGIEDGRALQAQFPNNSLVLKEYVTSHSVTVIRSGYTTRTFKFIIYPLTLVVGSICTYKCYQFQNDPSNKFSERTKQMYHLLILGLVIEMLAEFFWFIIPYVCVPIYLPVEKQVIAYYVVYRMFYAYPSFVMIFTLVFYKRYNMGAREVFGFIKENLKIPQVSATEQWTGNTVN